MAFTKIVAAGINTGSSYTFQDLNTVGVVTAATVQVGSATTVHTTGIDLGSGNINSHNLNSTGIITATSFVGPVTGNVTGNADSATTATTATTATNAQGLTGSPSITVANITASGNVSIAGTLTYEDVTNIDSVGIVTAQSGIHVTGGSVGIGTTNPAYSLEVFGNNALISGSSAANLILEDRGVADASNPFFLLASDGGDFKITTADRNGSGTTTNSTERLRINDAGDLQVGNITNLVASGAGKLNILSDNTTNLGIATDGAINIACVGGAGGSRTQSINWVPGFNVTLPTASIGHVFTDGSGYGKGDLFFATRGATTNTAATERLRITSDGRVKIGNDTNYSASTGAKLSVELMSTAGTILEVADQTAGYSTLESVKNAGGGATDYGGFILKGRRDADDDTIEYLRIKSDGKVGVGMDPSFELDVTGRFRATHGSSGLFFEEVNNGAALWLDGANGDFSGGDYYGIIANNNARLQFGYAGSAHMELNTSGQLYLNGYPHTHTVASGSHLKLRAGQGAWGISLGMRSTQNDYAYFGFTDMNGTEQIGDIFMQRTGTSTGHMVFSTNNGSSGSTNRLKIHNTGRIVFAPNAAFGSGTASYTMSVVNNGNAGSAGYPGIHIISTASGGTTNSMPGMSIVSTDAAWSLYGDSGNVHGLGILTGNTATSGNAAMYIRSDKKVSLGPQCFNSSSSSTYAHSALHVTGGSLSIGPLNNHSSNAGREGGRYVHGWYMTTYSSGGGSYIHIKTNLWAGGSPHGNYQYIMGGFHILGYRYSTSGISRSTVYFHNWSGAYPNLDIENEGSWDPGSTVYTSSDGYVVLRMANAAYYGYVIDLVQHIWYNTRDIQVTATQYSSSANAY